MVEIMDPVVSSDMVTALVAILHPQEYKQFEDTRKIFLVNCVRMAYDLFCNNKGDLRIFHKTVSRYN